MEPRGSSTQRIRWLTVLGIGALITTTSTARADEVPAEPVAAQINLESDTQKPAEAGKDAPGTEGAPSEAPPPPPYKKTLVLDTNVGALVFLGQFRKVAPPGPWMHTQLGYELLKFLMLFGEAELAFTDTSVAQPPPRTRAFPMYGFGGGARLTIRFTDRFGAYGQGSIGAMRASIATNALGLIGFRDAESFGAYLAGRLGVEYYQLDRHLAFGLMGGLRLAQGFEKAGASRDTPAALDAGVSLRYAF